MSERNQPQNQGPQGQGGGQPPGQQGGNQPQGGQPQGGQPQGGQRRGQPQGGQARGQRQGRQQPPRQGGGAPPSGGSPVDALTDPKPKRYIVGVVGTLAVLAVAVFLTIFLVGAVGGQFVVSDDYGDMSSEQKNLQQKQFVQSLVSIFINLSPIIVLGLVALAGGAIGSGLDRPRNDVVTTAAVAAFAGVIAFMVLGVFLTSTQFPSGERFQSPSVEFTNLLINSVVTGIAGAIASAGGAFFANR